MSARIVLSFLPVALIGASPPLVRPAETPSPPTAAQWAKECEDQDEWDKPGPPFRIHGNTWYVGTCGISAILVTSPDGHALIDSGTAKGAELVRANVARLGFWIGDVKGLLMSHEHFDHVGGMSLLQEWSGAALITSEAAASVMRSGKAAPADPQFGDLPDMPALGKVFATNEKGTVIVAGTAFKPVPTPGHTPGGMSWTWESCEAGDCKTIVYADSLSPVSVAGYRFSDHPEAVTEFRYSIYRLAELDCDIIITPHPGASALRARILGPGLIDSDGCMAYAKKAMAKLDARLAEEADAMTASQ